MINLDGDYFGVLKITRGGGLAFFWKRDVESSSSNHIDALINTGKEDTLRFTSFYGLQRLT